MPLSEQAADCRCCLDAEPRFRTAEALYDFHSRIGRQVTCNRLLPLNSGGRLTGYVVGYPGYLVYFIDDAGRNLLEELIRQTRP